MISIVKSVFVHAPVGLCFDLTRSIEFHVASSKAIGARAIGGKTKGLSEEGDETTWSARFFGIRTSLKTMITGMRINESFEESLVSGFPKQFGHEYSFEVDGHNCAVTDKFEFESGFGILGGVFDSVFLRSKMDFLVQNRLNEIKTAAESERWREFILL